MSKTIVLKPYLKEKTYALSEQRVYAFLIEKDVNKHTVARAVEAQFDVKVKSVNVTNIAGKSKRTISVSGKRSVNSNGKRNDIKKAYVTLAEGFSLPFFAAIDEAEEQQQATQAKVDKAAAKQADKAVTKPARRGLLGKKAEK